jgi:hypothetical protein
MTAETSAPQDVIMTTPANNNTADLSDNSIANLPRIPRHPTRPANTNRPQSPTDVEPPTQPATAHGSSTRNLAIRRALQELTQERLDAEAAEKAAATHPAATSAPTPTTNVGNNTAAPHVELTPTPASGWPVCHGEHPLWFLVNGKQEQVIKALSISDHSIVIHVANEISHDCN